jgi:hypothetical protein
MVRRGSTVRVRQRAPQKARKQRFPLRADLHVVKLDADMEHFMEAQAEGARFRVVAGEVEAGPPSSDCTRSSRHAAAEPRHLRWDRPRRAIAAGRQARSSVLVSGSFVRVAHRPLRTHLSGTHVSDRMHL